MNCRHTWMTNDLPATWLMIFESLANDEYLGDLRFFSKNNVLLEIVQVYKWKGKERFHLN